MITKSPVFHNDAQRTRWIRSRILRDTNIPEPTAYPCLLVIFEWYDKLEANENLEHEYVYLSDLEVLKVGVGATAYVGSDRYPYTVVQVISPKRVVVQADEYKRTDKNGLSESQTYEYTPNPQGSLIEVTLRGNGRWVQKGESAKNGRGFYIGERQAYQDPSF